MNNLPTALSNQPIIPPVLQVSDASNSTGEEEKTSPEPEPNKARSPVDGEEDPQLLESVEEYAELGDYSNEELGISADESSAARPRLHVKSKMPVQQDFLERRERKNAKARARASRLREHVDAIASKPRDERSQEEQELLEKEGSRRHSKNARSRKRADEKKAEVERILAIPEDKRSKIEKNFLEITMEARSRKNLGDRMRRQRNKQAKMASPAAGVNGSFENVLTSSSTVESPGETVFEEKTQGRNRT